MTKEKSESKLTKLFKSHITTVDFCDYLDTKALSSLSQTSKVSYKFFKKELSERKEAKQLLEHIVKGEEFLALIMIKANPLLLLRKSEAIDYSGRKIMATAFQAALGAEDVIMCQKILPYFEELKDGKEAALGQFNEQFPNGLKAEFKKEKKTVYKFKPLIHTILNGTESAVEEALNRFRKDMTFNKEIHQGKHFNMWHLITAYSANRLHFESLENFSKRDLFWRKVIGYIQRQIPANYAQAFCSNLYRVAAKNETSNRSVKLSNNISFYSGGLGFDFAVYSRSQVKRADEAVDQIPKISALSLLKKYVEQKQSHLLKLESNLRKGYLISRNNRECLLP